MSPTRCLSSHLTTELLKFRNPQGSEENWISQNEHIDHYPLYICKVATVEIGAALLIVTATVESIAYGILVVASCPLLFVSSRPLDRSWELCASSLFTVYWNLGNVIVFNLFCTNVFTHESFARYSIDHWPRGQAFRVALFVGFIALVVFSREHSTASLGGITADVVTLQMLRPQDVLYIANWTRIHQVQIQANPIPINGNLQPNQLAQMTLSVTESIVEGTAFFKENILDPGQVDEETKKQIIELEPDSYVFVITRSIYVYVFGTKRNESIPLFFKLDTKNAIQQLRDQFQQDEGSGLESRMHDLLSFNHEQDGDPLKTVFNRLKEAAHRELQNSLFITECWKKACEEYEQAQEVSPVVNKA